MPIPFLAVEKLNAHWGKKQALSDISFALPLGERLALLGPNGCGKSTLLAVLAGLHRVSSGTISLDGKAVRVGLRSEVGMAFQTSSLDGKLSVRENLRLHARLQGLRAGWANQQMETLLTKLGLLAKADERVITLSGGQHRRAELAKALLHRPRLLLLDEPTAGLDPLARKDFWNLLASIETPFSMIVSTHLLDEAELCQQAAVLHDGSITSLGHPQQLRRSMQQHTLVLGFAADDTTDGTANAKSAELMLEKLIGRLPQRQNGNLKMSNFPAEKLPQLLQMLTGVNHVQLDYPSLEEVLDFTRKPL